MQYFLYMLTDPRKGHFESYVGVTIYPQHRVTEHMRETKPYNQFIKSKKAKWLRDLATAGLFPLFHILDVLEDRDQ